MAGQAACLYQAEELVGSSVASKEQWEIRAEVEEVPYGSRQGVQKEPSELLIQELKEHVYVCPEDYDFFCFYFHRLVFRTCQRGQEDGIEAAVQREWGQTHLREGAGPAPLAFAVAEV